MAGNEANDESSCLSVWKGQKSLSVVLPCYNEHGNIESVINNCLSILIPNAIDYEIIVVDDGSKDSTSWILSRLSQKEPRLHAIRHNVNLGYGAALRTGFAACSKDLVFFMDSDGQFDFKEITALLPYLLNTGIVTGWRQNRSDPLLRKLNAWCFRRFVQLLFGLQIRDLNCAFKLFRRDTLLSLQLKSNGAFINAEILLRLKHIGFQIMEVPVSHKPRQWGKQTGANPRVIARAFLDLVQLYGELRRGSMAHCGNSTRNPPMKTPPYENIGAKPCSGTSPGLK